MKVGIVGLGKMGSRIAQKLIKDSHDVIVWNRTREDVENLKKEIPNLKSAETIKELVESLETPRIIWIMVPSIAIDEVISEVQKYLQKGDIVIDGGNSDYKETEKRTVMSGCLMDRTKEVFESDIKNVVGIIDATGEAEWTVEAAKEEGVPIEVIEKSLEFRKRSKIDSKIQNSFAAKVIAGLRHSFGGHSVVRKE